MPEQDRQRVKEIFVRAAELDSVTRAAFLESECGQNFSLRAEIEQLLQALNSPDTFLDGLAKGPVHDVTVPQSILNAGDCVGRFKIIRLIGRGGMGEVYEAADLHFGDHVAFKTIRSEFIHRPDFIARFRREIKLARRVTHANVCRLYDIGQETFKGNELVFLTMELLEGENLSERISRGRIPSDEAIYITRQVAIALGALHSARVIHRDLKPGNVLLVPSTNACIRVVITDFGLAHAMASDFASDTISIAGEILGTPAYMAPEQFSGGTIGPEADVYALGILMYEMLCGRRPYESLDFLHARSRKAICVVPSRQAGIDRRWDALILHCLEVDPRKRLQSIESFIAELNAAEQRRWLPMPNRIAQRRFGKGTLCAAAVSAICVLPTVSPRLRNTVMTKLCSTFPGEAAFCALPVDKDIAVLPFTITGITQKDRAAASGLARYIRLGFERMAPHPDKLCVHLRSDRLADGVSLVLEGNVDARQDSLRLALKVRQATGAQGRPPLVLRQTTFQVAVNEAETLHSRGLAQIARLLEISYEPHRWAAWNQKSPNYSACFYAYLQALGHLESGEYDQSIRLFAEAIDPGNDFAFSPAQVGLGEAYRLLLQRTRDSRYATRARQALERAVPLDRDFGFGGGEKEFGDLEALAGNPAAAEQHFTKALALSPFDIQLRKNAARVYESIGDTGSAETLLKDAVMYAPHCWLTHNTLADFFSRYGRFSEAERELLEVVRLAPDNANAYHNLAFDYIKVGRIDDAIAMASRSIRIRPVPRTYSTLGRALLYRGCSAAAISNLRLAVQLQPNDFVAWANLAEGLYATDPKSSSSLETFRRTVDLSAKTMITSQLFEKAYATGQHALNLVRGGQQTGDAIAEAEQAMAQAKGSNDIRFLAIQTFELAGLRDRALAEIEAGLSHGLSPHEIELSGSLILLRQDPQYARILKQFHFESIDPGGLMLNAQTCPELPIQTRR